MKCQRRPYEAECLCLRLQLLLDLATVLDTFQNALPVLIELQLGDNNLRGVNANWDRLAGGFVLGDSLDMDDIFQTIDGGDFSFAALVGASDNEDFIVFADRDRSNLEHVRGGGGVEAMMIRRRTLCFSRSSLLKGALMMVRLTLEGAS